MSFEKAKNLFVQIFKFGIVGVIAFLIDYGCMIFLTEIFGINYLVSSTISFLISVVVNYLLSMHFVFEGKEDISKQKEFVIFVVLSAIGLAINELCMWLFTDMAGIAYYFSKIGATFIVMVWNFISRKIFLEKKS